VSGRRAGQRLGLGLAVAGLTLPGCFARVTAEGSFHDSGLARAAFELECPKDQIQVVVLHRNDGFGCAGSSVGVTGCGKKAVYVCSRDQTWLGDTAAAR